MSAGKNNKSLTLLEFTNNLIEIGFSIYPGDFSWRRSDGSIASEEAIEDICKYFNRDVQLAILEGWHKHKNCQFDIKNEDSFVILIMRDASSGVVLQTQYFNK